MKFNTNARLVREDGLMIVSITGAVQNGQVRIDSVKDYKTSETVIVSDKEIMEIEMEARDYEAAQIEASEYDSDYR